jgi:hypothetical protein
MFAFICLFLLLDPNTTKTPLFLVHHHTITIETLLMTTTSEMAYNYHTCILTTLDASLLYTR